MNRRIKGVIRPRSTISGAAFVAAATFRASRSLPLAEAFHAPLPRGQSDVRLRLPWKVGVSGSPASPSSLLPRQVFDGPRLEPESTAPTKSNKQQASTQFIIDKILDECLRFSARKPIMRQFDPNRSMWRRWKGTVIAETWKSAARRVLWACLVYVLLRKYPNISSSLDGSQRIWTELIAIVTFTLTFFVNEAYSCWRNCLNICYNLQGRLNDFGMSLAGCAKRDEPRLSSSSSKRAMQAAEDVEAVSTFTPGARKILTIISRYVRLFNILSYASFTRSHRPLLTPQGMRRMVTRGLLTEKENSILINSRVAATARHNEVLMWMFRGAMDARRAGHFYGGYGFEQNLLLRIQEIRGQGNYMQAILRGRMPFFYAHIVRILVGFITMFYPFVAFSSGLSLPLGIAGVTFLTLTYQGLFDLSKRFLDPFNNESYGFDPIQVDTLIAETNAGSRRWMFGLEAMPIPYRSIEDAASSAGGLDSFVLPDEGFTEEEIAQRDADKRLREEAEKLAAGPSSSALVDEEDMREKLEEAQQAAQDEFDEAVKILNAPPGADFVAGIDDQDEEPLAVDLNDSAGQNATDISTGFDFRVTELKEEQRRSEVDFELPSKKLYDQFIETAAEEYEEIMRREEVGDSDDLF